MRILGVESTATLRRLTKCLLVGAIASAVLAGCGGDEPATPPPAAPASQSPDTATAPATDTAAPAADGTAAADGSGDEPRSYEIRKRLIDAAASEDEWVPELTQTPIDSVAETLRRAEEAVAANRLDQGDNSAVSLYLSVLKTDPDNAEAKTGIDALVKTMLERAELAFTQNRYNETARVVPMLVALRPEDPGVIALKAKVDSGREVALMLAEAQRLASAGKLIEPEGENAAALYREVLRTDPQNLAAQQGLEKIERDLITRATTAAESGDYSQSDRLLAEASKAQPGSSDVQDAGTRIVELRQERADELLAQANAAIAGGDLEGAERILDELETVSAQAQGIDEARAQIERARTYATLKPGQSITDPLPSGGNAPELVVIPVGTFQMGTPEGEDDRKSNEGPRHAVDLRRGFALARAEVTVAQFRAFVNATGYSPTSRQTGRSTIYDENTGSMVEQSGVNWQDDHAGKRADGNLPVVHVSWTDARAYADWLARETGKGYRLPSEAEFEYVIRAGSNTRYPWGDGNPTRLVGNLTGEDDRSASRRSWSNAFPEYDDGYWGPAPVRSFEANRYGIHDINGNVSEWVEDCWHDNYSRAPADGTAWVNDGCARRVIRGGSWASSPDQARSGFRLTAGQTSTNARLGFRVARDL
ncbi:SUMF1/EgtB/PvdO family nonheme iron enzyme [Chiayiivirga flava]|uniref:Formylglycine-generating enzyme required for sulfatase activity n=1 Tax=Chiayiivirga flava TaxID=659595 RepID=A0A7W8D5E0_9GAMM|nr:formylglycine-generating enzyme required for sulfatase activity [Chiayiivirga flava]